MIKLLATRFGEIEVDEGKEIRFAQGLFGFPEAHRYVLLYPGGTGRVAWLQSLELEALAFPVVEGSALGPDYPQPGGKQLAQDAGLTSADPTVLVIVAAQKGGGLIANMLAPLVVDPTTRQGAQLVLDPQRYSAAAPLRQAQAQAGAPGAALPQASATTSSASATR